MSRTEFKITSSRGDCELYCLKWIPDGEIKAAVFISHGMEEHIHRYERFATYLNQFGIAVYGHDQVGHGRTSPDDLGFIAEKNGDDVLVNDMFNIAKTIDKDLPGVPKIIFGHSMGSFIIRRYITRYGDSIDGAVGMGTGQNPQGLVNMGVFMSNFFCKTKGTHSFVKLLDNLVMGSNNKPYPGEHPYRWLSTNDESNDIYMNDPLCGFRFTSSAYRDLLMLLKRLGKEEDFDNIPKDLRILFMSGTEDVIGDFGKGVDRTVKALEKYDVHPEVYWYDGMRHELLGERNNDKVYSDLRDWILSVVDSKIRQ